MVLFRYSDVVSGSETAKNLPKSNPTKRSKFVVRQLYYFSGRFKSVHKKCSVLCAKLDEAQGRSQNRVVARAQVVLHNVWKVCVQKHAFLGWSGGMAPQKNVGI